MVEGYKHAQQYHKSNLSGTFLLTGMETELGQF